MKCLRNLQYLVPMVIPPLCKQSPWQDHKVPLHLRPKINFYFLNIFLHNRRQFSVEVLMINGTLCFSQPMGSRIVKDIRTVC